MNMFLFESLSLLSVLSMMMALF